jgi:hypothetical protein
VCFAKKEGLPDCHESFDNPFLVLPHFTCVRLLSQREFSLLMGSMQRTIRGLYLVRQIRLRKVLLLLVV